MTDYQLIRSQRRTLSISVDGEGALVVRAPMRMPVREIEAFILQKREWIAQKQVLAQSSLLHRQQAQLSEGGCIPFCGGELLLRFKAVSAAFDKDGYLFLPETGEALQHALKWRRRRAEELLAPRVEYWAQQTGLRPQKTGYGNAGSRWGSMSAQRSLRLNTALVHLPPAMADYVIVHELAHIRHPDHSPAFHALVRSILPGADALRREMKNWAYVTRMWK